MPSESREKTISDKMNLLLTICLLFVSGTQRSLAEECLSRDYGNGGTVCVCNANHCDTVDPVEKTEAPHYLKYTSNKEGLRFKKEKGTFDQIDQKSKNQIIIKHNTFQEILGWGGAFTDATGINIKSSNGLLQEQIMRSYFSNDGIEYSLCRVPIGGTDFSTHAYTYHDTEDQHLRNFTLQEEDYKYKIPLIHQAFNLTNHNLKVIASAWIAPKWMKSNRAYSGIFGFLKENMYQTWSDYFVKFLDAYKNENISFWGITTGNEPSLAFSPSKIPSVAWLPNQMRSWIVNNLGPALRNSSHSSIKLMPIDDQRGFFPWYIEQIFQNETAKNYVDGVAVHWYWDKIINANVLTKTHDKFPDKFILATEACKGDKLGDVHVLLGSWLRAEEYASSILEDINNWVTGWLDWNMALDCTGGPTYINNNVDSPIIVNATGREFYKQPMFYAMGHFSKFVPRGSVKISASQFHRDIPTAAFKRPDGGIVVIILNKKDKNLTTIIMDEEKGEIQLELTSHSLTSVLYW